MSKNAQCDLHAIPLSKEEILLRMNEHFNVIRSADAKMTVMLVMQLVLIVGCILVMGIVRFLADDVGSVSMNVGLKVMLISALVVAGIWNAERDYRAMKSVSLKKKNAKDAIDSLMFASGSELHKAIGTGHLPPVVSMYIRRVATLDRPLTREECKSIIEYSWLHNKGFEVDVEHGVVCS